MLQNGHAAEATTHSWTPRHLLIACMSQEGVSIPYAFFKKETVVVSLTFHLHNTTWLLLPRGWTQHKFM